MPLISVPEPWVSFRSQRPHHDIERILRFESDAGTVRKLRADVLHLLLRWVWFYRPILRH